MSPWTLRRRSHRAGQLGSKTGRQAGVKEDRPRGGGGSLPEQWMLRRGGGSRGPRSPFGGTRLPAGLHPVGGRHGVLTSTSRSTLKESAAWTQQSYVNRLPPGAKEASCKSRHSLWAPYWPPARPVLRLVGPKRAWGPPLVLFQSSPAPTKILSSEPLDSRGAGRMPRGSWAR